MSKEDIISRIGMTPDGIKGSFSINEMGLSMEEYAEVRIREEIERSGRVEVEYMKTMACAFLEWADKNLYTQDEDGRWYNFPTRQEGELLKTEELYELFQKSFK